MTGVTATGTRQGRDNRPVTIHVRLEVRDTDRVMALVWELRQLEARLRAAGSPEVDELARMLDRFLADMDPDRPEEPPV